MSPHFRRQLIEDLRLMEINLFSYFGAFRFNNPMRRLLEHIYRCFTLLLVEDISVENQLINVELCDDIDTNESLDDEKII